jgi:hypothetical protein
MAIVKGYTNPTRGPVTADSLGFNGTTSILERDVDDEIFYLDPDLTPFILLSDAMGNEKVDNPRYEWYEKAERQKTVNLEADNGDVEGSAVTTDLGIADNDVVRPGDLVYNTLTAEIYLVTTRTDANTFVVVRGAAGSTASAAGADGDPLVVIGSAFAEGVDVPIPDEHQEVQKFNFTEIFRASFGGSGTREATQTYFGRGFRDRVAREKAREFNKDVERAFLLGGRSEVQASGAATPTAGTGVLRTTAGFRFFATSNVLDMANAALTEPDLEGLLEDVFEHTSAGDTRTLFASAPLITVLDMLAVDKIRTVSDPDLTYGIAVREWQTSHGRLLIVKHRLLAETGAALWARGGIIVDTKKIQRATLAGRGVAIKKNRQNPGVDGWVDEYIGELGMKFENAEVHGQIQEVAAAA